MLNITVNVKLMGGGGGGGHKLEKVLCEGRTLVMQKPHICHVGVTVGGVENVVGWGLRTRL